MSDPRDRFFEDFAVGQRFELGATSASQAEMIAFARQFDPQSFHLDPEAAAAGPFGGLVASGWHTAGLTMRLMVDRFLSPAYALGSPGIDELRFPAPYRPGHQLTVSLTIEQLIESRSKPDRGIVKQRVEVLEDEGSVVFSMLATAFWLRRPNPAGS